jgi:hypothetical protein
MLALRACVRACGRAGGLSACACKAQSIVIGKHDGLLPFARSLSFSLQHWLDRSGKTAAFALPVLHHMLAEEGKKGIYCLVLAPTR